MTALLEVRDLSAGYGDHEILRGLSLRLEAGELVAVIGPNGAGKSTLLKVLAGLVPPRAGRIALQGADIVCVPTNWVPIPGQAEGRQAMANILAMGAAHSNSMFIACADRVGTERGQPFEGQSLIVSYTGWPVAGPASRDSEEIVLAEVNLSEARRKRNWNAFNQVLRDRRKRQELFGGNLAGELLFAITLGAVCQSFGVHLSLAELLVVNLVASTLAGLIPAPGGVGAAEATLTACLVAFGVDESTAFAIAITHRLCTNYLPPIWGYAALRWLGRKGYV